MPAARKADPDAPAGPFVGFGPDALPFFRDLARHQTREWFAEHRTVYDQHIKAPLGALVEALAFAFAAHDVPLTGDARRSLFRIHRDVRFSKDKAPYKTHAGAVMTRDGQKDSNGLLYIQVGGEQGSFMAAGFYAAEPRDLAILRQAIAAEPERWLRTQSELNRAGLPLAMGDALTRMPRGFEALAGSPVADAVRCRHLIVRRTIAEARLGAADLVDDILRFTLESLPLLRFGWGALDRARGPS